MVETSWEAGTQCFLVMGRAAHLGLMREMKGKRLDAKEDGGRGMDKLLEAEKEDLEWDQVVSLSVMKGFRDSSSYASVHRNHDHL